MPLCWRTAGSPSGGSAEYDRGCEGSASTRTRTKLVKVEVYVPESHVDAVREALHAAGAGVVGNYDHCVSVCSVTGYWRPLAGASPYQGEIGEMCRAPELKVETRCPADLADRAVAAVRAVHPYEEPVISVLPLLL